MTRHNVAAIFTVLGGTLLGVGSLVSFVAGQGSPPLDFASTTDRAELNCTSRGLQRAGFTMDRYSNASGEHQLRFSDDLGVGIATIAKEPQGYLEITTRTYSHPTKIPLERARALTRRAYDGVAAACGLGEPREICSGQECAGALTPQRPWDYFEKHIDRVRNLVAR